MTEQIDRVKQFVKERDAALLSLDLKQINAFAKKWVAHELPDNEIGWRAIHKARTAITTFPLAEKEASKKWLVEHNSEHWDDKP